MIELILALAVVPIMLPALSLLILTLAALRSPDLHLSLIHI